MEGTHGPLFCDVAYPATGPGVIYDPTGATALSALTSGKEVRTYSVCLKPGQQNLSPASMHACPQARCAVRPSNMLRKCLIGCTLNPEPGNPAHARAQLGMGNPGPVDTLTQCLIACEAAPGCSAVTYLPAMRNCFLKGCPSRFTVSCPVRRPTLWGPCTCMFRALIDALRAAHIAEQRCGVELQHGACLSCLIPLSMPWLQGLVPLFHRSCDRSCVQPFACGSMRKCSVPELTDFKTRRGAKLG